VIAPNPDHPLVRALAEGLREQGLIDGQTAIFEQRWASGRVDCRRWPPSSPRCRWT
jgi:hypothetical protein